ncbi:hypothetical protein T4D_13253 [Trichinella pseudospiralis]|uniref:Uncharacterized protein n=1 Tax=Trichinella pseudospiralis TaxID=6337 RepID=A0A0V1FEB6_TRIPS|nr:hypothetical protein T4D_13253 [Trichinella pseudospiralis]
MGNSVFTVLSMITHAPDEVKLHESSDKSFPSLVTFMAVVFSAAFLNIYVDYHLKFFTLIEKL